MFRHNLVLIYRNFMRFRSAFLINLVGLSTGLTCTLMIYLWVDDELQMDQFHANGNRIVHLMEHRKKADGIWTSETTAGPLAETIIKEMPEIEYALASSWTNNSTFSVGDHNVKASGKSVGPDFFKVFSYDLVQGNKNSVLVNKSAMVISESLAVKLFGTTENVVGKAVEVDHKKQHIITGVFRDVTKHSSEQFEYLLTFESYREDKEWLQYWGNTAIRTILLLKPGTDLDQFNAKIADYVKVKTNGEVTYRTMFAKPIPEKYLYGQYENGVLAGGRITYVKLFSVIAVFILIIACINFMNLSTAKASRRIKEVGIKKAVGAGRRMLIFHYLGESLLLSFVSLLVAILATDLLLPQFNEITGKQLALELGGKLLLTGIGIATITGILAGSYPALYLSGFNPAVVLKGKLNTSLGEIWARKGLVVFQFVLSVIFIVSVFVVYKQIEYVQSKSLGYVKDNIVYFEREGKLWSKGGLESFLPALRSVPGVVSASATTHDMTGHNSGTWDVQWPGRNPDDRTEFENFAVDNGMIETLGIEMAAGRSFSPQFTDTARIIFNEAAIAFMGMTDPIGKTVKLWGRNVEIIGIVKDFHFESLHENYKPAFFRFAPSYTYLIMAKLEAGKETGTLDRIRDFYEKYNEGFAFDYKFLDEDYQSQYIAEQRVATLSKYFAALAVLISCLGLFGLAAFTAERRLKEIGIRKVLGSSAFGIVTLLSADFTKVVLVSIVIALPVSYWLATTWLANFAFRITLEWWYFAAAGAIAVIIAWITVGTQAVKAAGINPTKCLKDE